MEETIVRVFEHSKTLAGAIPAVRVRCWSLGRAEASEPATTTTYRASPFVSTGLSCLNCYSRITKVYDFEGSVRLSAWWLEAALAVQQGDASP